MSTVVRKQEGACVAKPGLPRPRRRTGCQIPAKSQDTPSISRLSGEELALPNAQVLGKQVQDELPCQPQTWEEHGCHLGVEAGARAGKRKLFENQIFFFFYINSLVPKKKLCSPFYFWLFKTSVMV